MLRHSGTQNDAIITYGLDNCYSLYMGKQASHDSASSYAFDLTSTLAKGRHRFILQQRKPAISLHMLAGSTATATSTHGVRPNLVRTS
mmetsp:Transcript_25849/g.56325  ORF Transcript_25849/g.56325 Transcript_25849/m.56325 type:complete len:88 (+) Transcript_25849:760-1023(+)